MGFIQDNVLADKLAEVAGFQELFRKTIKDIGYSFILLIRPVKGLVETLFPVIRVVFGINSITDYKHLYVLE